MKEIYIYDLIGSSGISSKEIIDQLAKIGPNREINVRINSPGGGVFEGLAIYTALKRHKGRVIVDIDAQALSIASVIAMAGDEINIAENAWMMIHQPWSAPIGTAEELRKEAEMMDRLEEQLIGIYHGRTGIDINKISTMMEEETWMSAAEAVDLGFADALTEKSAIAAMVDLQRFRHPPEAFVQRVNQPASKTPRLDAVKHRLAAMNLKALKIRRDKIKVRRYA